MGGLKNNRVKESISGAEGPISVQDPPLTVLNSQHDIGLTTDWYLSATSLDIISLRLGDDST